jgi:hypothetical protein
MRRVVVRCVVMFAAIRLLMLLAIRIVAHQHHKDVLRVLIKADGLWYLRIAQHGYGAPPPIGPNGSYTHTTTLAFFPLYPYLIRAVSWLGFSDVHAALLVTALAGLVAATLIAMWAVRAVGSRAAVVLVGIWSMLPASCVFDMAYSEALFVAAAAWCLLALQRRRLVPAAVAATIGGLTRPTGGCLVLAVYVAVLAAAWQDRKLARDRLLALLIAPAGLLFSLGHVAVATGRLDGWFWLERTVWNSGFDAGRSGVTVYDQLLFGGRARHVPPQIMAAFVVVAFIVLTIWWLLDRRRPSGPDVAYSVSAEVLAIGERHYFHVKPRFLLVAFPVLAPLALRLARLPTWTLVGLGAVALAGSLWWNAYFVATWPASV